MDIKWTYNSATKEKDVTNVFNEKKNENTIQLVNYNHQLDGDIDPIQPKYLKCTILSNEFENKYFKIKEDHPIVLLNPFENIDYNKIRLNIVYFATLFFGNHGISIIKCHLIKLLETDILQTIPSSQLHIVITINSLDESVEKEINSIFPNEWISKKVYVYFSFENTYEYEGIKKVYDIGMIEDDGYILYFHSKGMSRLDADEYLHHFINVISEWKWVLFLFQNLLSINKIGLLCSEFGWIWFNFWWVRVSYIKNLECPLRTSRRHYYEDWIARYLMYNNLKKKTLDIEISNRNNLYYRLTYVDCFNLGSDINIGHHIHP